MLDVLAVLLCRLFATCAGVAVGIPDKGACSVAVASFASLLDSLSPPVCQPPAARSRFLPLPLLAPPATSSPAACARSSAFVSSLAYRYRYE